MKHFMTLLDLAVGHPLSATDDGRARRLQLAILAMFIALGFAGLWGIAAGSGFAVLALQNAYKIPMIVLLSAVCAAPAGLLTWKLSGATGRATDLLLRFAVGIFSSTLVLAVLAPLVALYYRSSAWAGPIVGQGSVAIALIVGTIVFGRAVIARIEKGHVAKALLAPTVFLVVQLATVLQLIALASPILPERTVFSHGIDHIVPSASTAPMSSP